MYGCVLFADISGSSRLYEGLGDRRAAELITHALDRMCRQIEGQGGWVVKTLGDEVMAVFQNSDSALACAMHLPDVLSDLQPPLKLRQGLHYGELIKGAGDVYGDTVNTTARLASLARAGQILIGAALVATLSQAQQQQVRRLDSIPLRGKDHEVGLYEAIIEAADMTQLLSHAKTIEQRLCLCLQQGEHERCLHPGATLSLGRAADNDWVIASTLASRRHARIEVHGERCTLTDFSSNGTLILTDQGERLLLRHTSHVLHGQGWIACGEEAAANSAHSLFFKVQGEKPAPPAQNADTPERAR